MEPKNISMHAGKADLFYGWWIVFAGFFILFVASGIGFFVHGIILDPLRQVHGWSKGTVSAAITLFFFSNGVAGFIIGRWMDRYGPKWFLVTGSMVFGLGLWSLNWIDTTVQLFCIYLVMSIGFTATALVPVNMLITNWFVRKRGLAMSVANIGLSAGGMFLVPLTSYLIAWFGLGRALPTLGAIYMLAIIPIAIFMVRQRPSDMGQFPDGETSDPGAQTGMEPTDSNQMRVWRRTEAVKTVAFWSIAIAFMLALAGQIAFLVHQVSFLGQYLGPQKAAVTVSITTAASITGRLILGAFVDRCDKRYVAMFCIMAQGVALLVMAFSSYVPVLYLCTFAFGLTMGGLLTMQSLLIGECFGIPSFATVSGAIGLCSMPGSAFGPVVAGVIFDATHSYQWSFILLAAVSFLAVGIVFFAKPPAVAVA